MRELRRSLDDYLTLRRALGYKLEDVGRMLRGFVAFAERGRCGPGQHRTGRPLGQPAGGHHPYLAALTG